MAEKKRNNNPEIAGIFYEMAEILELQNIKWKPNAYIAAAQTIESLKKDVSEIYKKDGVEGINKLPGIGEGLTKKIVQFIETGKIDEHERLKKSIPAGLYDIMKVPGIGAKKASLFYNQLGIKNIDDLEKAAKEKRLIGLPGFKEKAEERILEGIEMMKNQRRILLKDAEKIADKILKELRKLPEVEKAIAAGSIRRKKSTIGDIDIIVETLDPENVLNKFAKMKFVGKILGVGKEKATIITKDDVQVDVRVADKNFFGACLLYFTGDKNHNIWLRKIAIKKGWKLSEYGLFKGNKMIAGKTEEEIYSKLGLKFIKPEDRIGELSK